MSADPPQEGARSVGVGEREPDARELEERVGGEPRNRRSREGEKLVGALERSGRLGEVAAPRGVPRPDRLEQEGDERPGGGRPSRSRRPRRRRPRRRPARSPRPRAASGDRGRGSSAPWPRLRWRARPPGRARSRPARRRPRGAERRRARARQPGARDRPQGAPSHAASVSRASGRRLRGSGARAGAKRRGRRRSSPRVAVSAQCCALPARPRRACSQDAAMHRSGWFSTSSSCTRSSQRSSASSLPRPHADTASRSASSATRPTSPAAAACSSASSSAPISTARARGGTMQRARLFRLGSLELPGEEVADDARVAVAAAAVVERDGHAGALERLEHLRRVGPREERVALLRRQLREHRRLHRELPLRGRERPRGARCRGSRRGIGRRRPRSRPARRFAATARRGRARPASPRAVPRARPSPGEGAGRRRAGAASRPRAP